MPQDVVTALEQGRDNEEEASASQKILETILENIPIAREKSTPLCQDTGTNIWYVHYPTGVSTREIQAQINRATVEATKHSYLRPNAVDPISGLNSGDNIGAGHPQIHFEEWDGPGLKFDLMLKGGGCENVGTQYSLPHSEVDADRDLLGVHRVVLDAVQKAQGRGCPPGILGVCIGGDRGTGYLESKRQLFRKLDDINPVPELKDLEGRILRDANGLGIGPMGFGGKTTLLGVKIGTVHRLPASFFVTVSYMCWECRRRSMTYHEGVVQID